MDPSTSPDSDRAARRRASALLATGAVLAALVLREGWRETSKARTQRTPIDARFASFTAPARGERRIGTLLDAGVGPDAEARRAELEFALAPMVLVAGTDGVRLVAVWADSPVEAERLAAKHRLRFLAKTADGYALYEKTKP